jgi:hypothetical protein
LGVDLNEIVEFCYSRNPVWQQLKLSKEKLKVYLGQPWVNHIAVYQNNQIVGVGVYLKDRIHVHFISLTVREKAKGMKIIRFGIKETIKKEKPRFISWLTPEYKLRTMEVK